MPKPDELVCHECGTINDRERTFCELCEDPLDDERREQPKRAFFADVAKALAVTAPVYWVGSIPTRFLVAKGFEVVPSAGLTLQQLAFTLQAPRGGGFWFLYTLALVVLVMVAPLFHSRGRDANPLLIFRDWGEDETVMEPRIRRGVVSNPATRQCTGCIYAWTAGLAFLPFAYLYELWARALRQFDIGFSDSS